MMDDGNDSRSKFVVVLFWIAAVGCFAFGYYNTVMALRLFNAFGSAAGSWFLALIPLVMVFGGYLAAVRGKREMMYLYLAGELLFFVANLTYIYPQYLGRTLVNEEATVLKKRMDWMPGALDSIGSSNGTSSAVGRLQELRQHQTNLLTEIKYRGFGPNAKNELKKFNELAGSSYTQREDITTTAEKTNNLVDRWKRNTDQGIRDYLVRLNGNDMRAARMVAAKYDLDSLVDEYTPRIEEIIDDNSYVSIVTDSVRNNPQILTMKELTTKLDNIAISVNSAYGNTAIKPLVSGKETIAFPKTQKLGRIEHTLNSVWHRLGKLDTWGVIVICLLFDLLGPFLFYFYIRRPEDYYDEFPRTPWWKKRRGI